MSSAVEICEHHQVFLSLYDDGNVETGPNEPYLDCHLCRKEQEPCCPQCGEGAPGFTVKSIPTRNYGGGYDTYESCTVCGYREVYV